MRKIDIFDTTLRDGEQSAGINLNTAEKIEIARQLERLGVTIIEAGFPASSPGDLDAVQKIASTVKNSIVTGLARCVQSDIDAAWEALKGAEQPHVHVFLATSPIHMEYKLKKSPDQVVEQAIEAVKYAKKFFPLVEWSAEDGFRSDRDFLVRIIEQVIQAGATTINVPDTVGYASPQEYGELFRFLRENVRGADRVKFSAHCHDDLGMAVANSIAAMENGADQIECTINGIGERAGNAALEEIAVALHIRNDFYPVETGINLKEIKRTSQLVSRLTGSLIQPNKAVVGKNAFAHESGIHQDGVLKHKETYEIISPALIGEGEVPLVLGKHSGRAAFRDRAVKMGYELSDEKLNKAFQEFKKLADRKKEITEDDLITLLTEQQVSIEDIALFELKSVQVSYGTDNIPTATASVITPDGDLKTIAATGAGSVEAIFNTLEQLVNSKVNVLDFQVKSVSKGRDALADAVVNVRINGAITTGRDSSQDVLEATANAFIDAINRNIIHENIRQKQTAQV
ncbi:2-isopropylmalate synthase [Ureibacillus manganicus]|uniref:2-isopropylmalate synthase n=1 Tax=Ureibacillus manganicus DSM 26584 TaxID=1384049 RepID=A0A0A3IVG8_9BACL|nr:2-isopropylmalate synthase [Ureibacillus manganicus]KGR78792.1 2-isopropylmalate synthase [Ureibacillus manganicus DSM 26584]